MSKEEITQVDFYRYSELSNGTGKGYLIKETPNGEIIKEKFYSDNDVVQRDSAIDFASEKHISFVEVNLGQCSLVVFAKKKH
ncbi:MAG TPA: hypothetical protein VLE44_03105 [Candidatus Saccharimonadales bacterium]|nr:hypothetical protein [Candidatus Saccharimonadales bacterium]